jgi:hypothetical protein
MARSPFYIPYLLILVLFHVCIHANQDEIRIKPRFITHKSFTQSQLPLKTLRGPVRVALVLGGGAARGMSHIVS